MANSLLKRLALLELATIGEPSPLYLLLVELTLAKGNPMPTIDKNDHVAVMTALAEVLPG